MKTKEEIIKDAWDNVDGSNKNNWANYWTYDKAKEHGMDKNGWIKVCGYEPEEGMVCDYMRPPQLKGIENNNSWIKIESEEDINLFKDKERDFVFIKTSDCNESKIAVYSNLYKCFTDVYNNEIENVTHYQPIEKPKPPLY